MEREAVEEGAHMMDVLAAGLEQVSTPDGRTRKQIEAADGGKP
ncbi:hypothetical protein [Paracoccus lichenicola]|nr:hypothetical protein [Paracoccus lichenicola]